MKVDGNKLIEWGFKPGKWFKPAIEAADKLARENHFQGTNHTEFDMIAAVKAFEPVPIVVTAPQNPANVPTHYNLDAQQDFELDNLEKVKKCVATIAQVPVVRAISVMPDACPTGGGMPVGGVAVVENAIIPGMHSADICCSVAMTVFPSDTDPTALLDAGMKISHFGKGGRPFSHDMNVPRDLMERCEMNPYLSNKGGAIQKHFGTQGDGNHFYYVGRLDSTGQIALVTHHGSRAPGAMLYNKGIEVAKQMSAETAPYLHHDSLWIPYDTQEGQDYWEALQLIRRWTKGNHFTIHNAVAKAVGAKDKDRHWNEHNFVFKREFGGKNYFVHAKGATPAYQGFGPDTFGKVLIPLNMAQPILVGQVHDDVNHGMDFINSHSLGFAPHGAGRNFSRTEFGLRMVGKVKDMIADVTSKYDIRAFSGAHDASEFPAAYKDADTIREQIKRFGLTSITDMIQPIGCIMAGHDATDYRAIKRAKQERRRREAEQAE